jgi:hypothetical protein
MFNLYAYLKPPDNSLAFFFSRDSSVDIAKGYEAEVRDYIPSRGRELSLLSVQTGSMADPASNPIGIGEPLPR